MIEAFEEAVMRTPALNDGDDDSAVPVRNQREQANWKLNVLLQHRWLELHMDEVALTSTYSFSRIARLFTQPMEKIESAR